MLCYGNARKLHASIVFQVQASISFAWLAGNESRPYICLLLSCLSAPQSRDPLCTQRLNDPSRTRAEGVPFWIKIQDSKDKVSALLGIASPLSAPLTQLPLSVLRLHDTSTAPCPPAEGSGPLCELS